MNQLNTLIVLFAFLIIGSPSYGQKQKPTHDHSKCGSSLLLEWQKKNRPEAYEKIMSQLKETVDNSVQGRPASTTGYHLPVVFHVIADNMTTLLEFTPARIQDQLDRLNYEFNVNNPADIEFCLAQETQSGVVLEPWSLYDATNVPGQTALGQPGVTYTLSSTLDDFDYSDVPNLVQLRNTLQFYSGKYLNVYIVDEITLDGQSVDGVSPTGVSTMIIDGIAVLHEVFGDGNYVSGGSVINTQGKVAVHEVGHWLGLLHTFTQDACTSNCCTPSHCEQFGDLICDTPPNALGQSSDDQGLNCNSATTTLLSCQQAYLPASNHMDYAPESCLDVFTAGQIAKMHHILNTQRSQIVTDANLIAVGIMGIGKCKNEAGLFGDFLVGGNQPCPDVPLQLIGSFINATNWTYSAVWNSSNTTPMPAGAQATFTMLTGLTGATVTGPGPALNVNGEVSFSDPGIWDVVFTITNGANTISYTETVTVNDCSSGLFRNRLTAGFDDWLISGMTSDNANTDPSLLDPEGYILAGSSLAGGHPIGVIVRTDSEGNFLWRKEIAEPGVEVRLLDVAADIVFPGQTDLCYAFTGYKNVGFKRELLFLVTDISGNIIFQRTYDINATGKNFNFSSGFQIIQLSNNDFVIGGISGEGLDRTQEKMGVVLCIDDANGNVLWNKTFNSTALVTYDYDIVENVTEIHTNYGGVPVHAVVVGGNFNYLNQIVPTIQPNSRTGIFLECLDINNNGQRIWEHRTALVGELGYLEMVATAFDGDRLFSTFITELSHGTIIVEMDHHNQVNGVIDILHRTGFNSFHANDMVLDNQHCVLKGHLNPTSAAAVKVAWDSPSAPWAGLTHIPSPIMRNYDYSGIPYMSLNPGRSILKSQNINISPTPYDGYIMFGESQIPGLSFGSQPLALVVNRVDQNMLGACSLNYGLSTWTLPLGMRAEPNQSTIYSTSITSGISPLTDVDRNLVCARIGCDPAGLTPQTTSVTRCSGSNDVLLSFGLHVSGNYSFNWTPNVFLDDPSILEPTSSSPVDQVYNLVITDNVTQCVVFDEDFSVFTSSNPPDIVVPCLTDIPGLFTFDQVNNQYLIDFNILLNNANLPLNGTWAYPASSYMNGNVMEFDIMINGSLADFLPAFSNLHYSYSAVCPKAVNIRLGLDPSVIGVSGGTTTVCNGETRTFTGANAVSTWEHQWRIIDPSGALVQTIGWSTNPSMSYTFNSTSSSPFFVQHFVRNTACPNDQLLYGPNPGATFSVTVINETASAVYDACRGELIANSGSTIQSVQWHAQDGTPISGATNLTFLPSANGDYFATVVISNCIVTTNMVTYTMLPVLSATTLTSDYNGYGLACNGDNNGTITLNPQGGGGSYTYLWTSFNGGSGLVPTDKDQSGLTAGAYSVTITDNNGCTTTASAVLTQPQALSITTQVVNNFCNAGNLGSIDLNVNGGIGPYSYQWQTTNGSGLSLTTEDQSGLSAGDYNVTATDALGCEAFALIVITEPTSLSISTQNTNILCNGDNTGSIDLTVTGGTGSYSYQWQTVNGAGLNSSNEDQSGLTAGTYDVTVTDANGCTGNTSVILTEPATIGLTGIGVNPLCNNGNDGSIDLVVSGGAGSYSYQWQTANGSGLNSLIEDQTGLTAGTYTVTITDANGCESSTSVTLSEPNAISISTSLTNPLCNGDNSGSINVTVSGGTGSYSYQWQTSNGSGLNPTSEDQSGLTAGTYNVTITDANGCTSTTSVLLTEPAILSLTTVGTDILCNGDNTGAIDLTVTGGTGSYSYQWQTLNGSGLNSSIEDQSGLTAGTYDVTVTDANGCTGNTSVILTEPAIIGLTGIGVNPQCNNGNDGSIDFMVSGGTGSYSYQWQTVNGSGLNSLTEDQTGLTAGTYTVTITDANGCESSTSVTLSEPNAISISTSLNNPLCNGDNSGSINVTVSGGTGSYSYQWQTTNGSGLNPTSEDQSGLTAGTYNVTITDANGCTSTTSVLLTEPAILSLTTVGTDILCNGDNTGAIDLTVTGGTGSYSYQWQTVNGAGLNSSNEDQSGLAAGTYDVTVTDANGCEEAVSILLTEPSALNIASQITAPICNGGNDGSIDLSISGGTGGYSYQWQTVNGSGLNPTSEDQSGLTAGTYEVTVTDANNCTTSSSVIVTQPAAVVFTFVVSNVVCNGGNDGAIDMTVTGSGYSYAWQTLNGSGLTAGAEDQTGLTAGDYSVTVTDSQGCSSYATITVNEPIPFAYSLMQPTVCNCNGAILSAPPAGTVASIVDVAGNPVGSQNLCSGAYTLTWTSNTGCLASASFNLSGYSSPALTTPNLIPTTPIPASSSLVNPIIVTNSLNVPAGTVLTLTNQYVIIDNGATASVDGRLVLEGSTIVFENENHQLDISQTGVLNLTATGGTPSVLTAGPCGRTWAGVRNRGSVDIDGSIIEHARIGILSNGAGPIVSSVRGEFLNNYVAIRFRNDLNINLKVEATDFLLDQPTLRPYPWSITSVGPAFAERHIDVNNCTEGNGAFFIANNTFTRADIAMEISRSRLLTIGGRNQFFQNKTGVELNSNSRSILLRNNSYRANSTLNDQLGIHIIGDSEAEVVRSSFVAQTSGNYTGIKTDITSQVLSRNNNFIGSPGLNNIGIYTRSFSSVDCRNSKFTTLDVAIKGIGGSNLTIERNRIFDCGTGVKLNAVSSVSIRRNSMVQTITNAWPIPGTKGVLLVDDVVNGTGSIDGNVMTGNEVGVHIRNGGDALVSRNVISQGKVGVLSSQSGKTDVVSNRIDQMREVGIWFSAIAEADASSIFENTIENIPNGIRVRNSYFASIGENQLKGRYPGNTGDGIALINSTRVPVVSYTTYNVESNLVKEFERGIFARESEFRRMHRNDVASCKVGLRLIQDNWQRPAELTENTFRNNRKGMRASNTGASLPQTLELLMRCNLFFGNGTCAKQFDGGNWKLKDLNGSAAVFSIYTQGGSSNYNKVLFSSGSSVMYFWPNPLVQFPSPFTKYQPSVIVQGSGSHSFGGDPTATVEICRSVRSLKEEQIETSELLVYPNPTNGELSIRLEGSLIRTIQVFNVLGQEIATKTGGFTNSINLSHLNDGVYLVRVVDQLGEVYNKQVVLHKQ